MEQVVVDSKLTPEQSKALGHVALIYGGQSAEREISLKSGAAVEAAFKRLGISHDAIDLRGNIFTALNGKQYDRAFLMLHGVGGEDGTVQGALENLKLPYTGSGVLASALAMDKVRTKQLWAGVGLSTPKYEVLTANSNWSQVLDKLGGQVIVKPAHEGSSIGMSKATTTEELQKAYEKATQYDAYVLAETWITGAEYTVGILNGSPLPVIKLETNNSFYDFEAKYISNDTRYLIPSGLSNTDETELQSLALAAFNSVGCRGWGRVDVMRDGKGQFYLLEVNTLPGMTDHSLVPMAAKYAGIGFDELVYRILVQTL